MNRWGLDDKDLCELVISSNLYHVLENRCYRTLTDPSCLAGKIAPGNIDTKERTHGIHPTVS